MTTATVIKGIAPYKFREVHEGDQVLVYRNLHKTGGKIYSIQCDNHVAGHTKNLIIANVKAVIRKAGHRKAVESGVRNVHAFLKGEAVQSIPQEVLRGLVFKELTYNPFKMSTFQDLQGNEVITADYVRITDGVIEFANREVQV